MTSDHIDARGRRRPESMSEPPSSLQRKAGDAQRVGVDTLEGVASSGTSGDRRSHQVGNIRGETIDLSVVVPTFNRRDRLLRVLDALGAQALTTSDGSSFAFEVVVVSDGSTDGTTEAVASYRSPFPLRFLEQQNAGPAAARNAGFDVSIGRIVVFIDDDVIPEPGCLRAHVDRHVGRDDLVVIGPMLTPTDVQLSPWVAWEQHQLEKQYVRFEQNATAHHRQFYTGNASLPRRALVDVGGFDTTLLRAEDVELAHRLHLAGMSFVFEPKAEAFHHAERSLESWRRVAYDYGQNDVRFASNGQPEVFTQIRGFFSERHRAQRMLVRYLVPRPRRAAVVKRVGTTLALAAARIGLVAPSRALLSIVYGLHYYTGVSDAIGGPDEFERLMDPAAPSDDFVAWFVLEQTLGHITHGKNLQSLLPEIEGVEPVFTLVDDALTGPWRRLPGWTNWTVRAGVRARRGLRTLQRDGWSSAPDAIFVHSQVPAVLLGRWMRTPTVVSLDATPLQYDSLGEFYQHEVGSGPGERLKKWANRRCYARARHLVTWSEWAKQGLVDEYGVAPDKVTVIAPGVDVDMWAPPADQVDRSGPVRVLFVGGDLERKGGHLLLSAAAQLRDDAAVPDFEVHLVTPAAVADEPGVVVHAGLSANSAELIEQYHLADIFCLPTFGDCLPMVLAEAGASGLPLVSTDVGAISGLVRDGVTGRLIQPGDLDQLVTALRELLVDPDERRRCGKAARELVIHEHDARRNAQRIVDVLRAAI
jgi:glycosyltransferase involved in cell wall biosynthesis